MSIESWVMYVLEKLAGNENFRRRFRKSMATLQFLERNVSQECSPNTKERFQRIRFAYPKLWVKSMVPNRRPLEVNGA